jgi:1-aminocyclopropane-1-carboxylate deaminase/D-cysteine desulfhydrase-like pyridoxal-dependent ACC family enzyme
MASFHDSKTMLPRLALGAFPTPLEDAPRLAHALGVARLLIKREDLSGAAFGGNKIRTIEMLLADAQARGCDAVVTTAGLQSNFCRALAGAAARVGMHCALLLRGAPPSQSLGNHFLDRLFGAEIRYLDVEDPWDKRARAALDACVVDLRARGMKPYLVHLPGESAGLGVASWVLGAQELAEQFASLERAPDRLIVSVGSGLTCAGLALGLKRLGSRCRVVAMSVQQPAPRIASWMIEAASRALPLLPPGAALAREDLDVFDDAIGEGYGRPTATSLEAVRMAARCEGLVLDPIYTGKALAGLAQALRDGRIPRASHVAFLHSGGAPGLFVHAGVFADI